MIITESMSCLLIFEQGESVSSMSMHHELSGFLPVHKPRGIISKDVSRLIEKEFRGLKLGHAGTLDPMAEGVLPLVLGKASRLQSYMVDCDKEYFFDLVLGAETDSLDVDGKVVLECPVPPFTKEAVSSILLDLVGDWEQVPPIYSAIKYKGKPLYYYARNGLADQVCLENLKKVVHIRELDLVHLNGNVLTVRLVCSKGTYVRCVAREVAQRLGTCGTVHRILRSASAGISLEDCVKYEDLQKNLSKLEDLIKPIEDMPLRMSRWLVPNSSMVNRLKMGQRLKFTLLDYRACLSGGESSRLEDDVLLVGDDKCVFGVGRGHLDDSGQFSISMRRAL